MMAVRELLSRCTRVGAPIPPPENASYQHHKDYNQYVESLHSLLQPLEVATEKISDSGNDADPDRGTQEIENRKSPPRHP